MADVQKYNASNLGVFAHDERNLNNPVQYRKNYEIDAARTAQNYDLISGKTGETAERGELQKRLDARLEQLTIRKRRANTVLFGSWVVTLPAELKKAQQEQQREFFRHTVQFVQNRYGAANVIGAWVHNDETTPHVHIKFVPEERKKTLNDEGKDVTDYNAHEGTGVLLAKDIFKRGEYQTFHRDLQTYLEQRMGMRLSILNAATKARGKNASIDELKAETALELEKTLEAAKAIQQAAKQWAESGKQAAAMGEQLGESVEDAKRQADRGGFLKSGWQKKLESLLKGLESVQEQEKTAQRAASALTHAARLVPDWAKSGPALLEAALQLSAKARQDAQEEKKRLQDWWQQRARKVSAREKAVAAAEAALDERREAFGREVDQAARRLLDAEGGKLAAAQQATAAALTQQHHAEQARDAAQRQQRQAVEALTVAQQQAQQAEQARDAAQRQQQQAERARDEAQEQAEGWREWGKPAAKLRAVLQECAEHFGAGVVITALELAARSRSWEAAPSRLDELTKEQENAALQETIKRLQDATPHTPPRKSNAPTPKLEM